MPNPNNKAKMTGDTHLPDVESELPLQQGSSGALGADGTPRGRASESDDEADKPGRGAPKAGVLREADSDAGGSNTRSSGSGPSGRKQK